MESRITKRVTTSHQKQFVTMSSYESQQQEATSGQEKRKAKKVITRSISLNFNSAHALSLRLRRGHVPFSPLHIRHPDFRQVDRLLISFGNK
ncbi:hypothetical protein AVEN_132622-1 [Araneus ventricosus]|uniref:Uncharacterized protein n=1 Tax=Araneus ventricosus TaxID=182803 RepID=A0A4Y2AV25_ARAVE|nr:hypothetical protein AVEN_132622-1 [Araneus ventricosus]